LFVEVLGVLQVQHKHLATTLPEITGKRIETGLASSICIQRQDHRRNLTQRGVIRLHAV